MSGSVVRDFFALEEEVVLNYKKYAEMVVERCILYTAQLAKELKSKEQDLGRLLSGGNSANNNTTIRTRSSIKSRMVDEERSSRALKEPSVEMAEPKISLHLSFQSFMRKNTMRKRLTHKNLSVSTKEEKEAVAFPYVTKPVDSKVLVPLAMKLSSDDVPSSQKELSHFRSSLKAINYDMENRPESANEVNPAEVPEKLMSKRSSKTKGSKTLTIPKSGSSNPVSLKECKVAIRRLSESHWIFQPTVSLNRLTKEEIHKYLFEPVEICTPPSTLMTADLGGRVKFSSLPLEPIQKIPRLSTKAKKSILKSCQTSLQNKILLDSSATKIMENSKVSDYHNRSTNDSLTQRNGLSSIFHTPITLKTPMRKITHPTPVNNKLAFKASVNSKNVSTPLKVGASSAKVSKQTSFVRQINSPATITNPRRGSSEAPKQIHAANRILARNKNRPLLNLLTKPAV